VVSETQEFTYEFEEVLFRMDQKPRLIEVMKTISKALSDNDIDEGDGLAAMMLLSHSLIATLNEDDIGRVVSMCIGVVSGNYRFEGEVH
jgi:hypothetical protein